MSTVTPAASPWRGPHATMLIGTLAIAGIPPFAGFFSKDEILFRAFLANKTIWVLAVATALMTAFYMFRLMAMTFFGAYRGPACPSRVHLRSEQSPRPRLPQLVSPAPG